MMSRWRESGRAPPLTLPTEARKRRRRVEPPKRVLPPWRRKRRKPPGCLPKRPPSVSFLFSDIVSFVCLIPVLMHFARFRKKATTSLKKSTKTLGASRNIKEMLEGIHGIVNQNFLRMRTEGKPRSNLGDANN